MKVTAYALIIMLFLIAALVGYYVMFIMAIIAASFLMAKVATIGQEEYRKAQNE